MLRWFQALMPREDRFFDMFNRHAATLRLGATALDDLLQARTSVSEGCRRVIQHENEADAIAREVLQAVQRSFITPFDRSDIKELINYLDDAIDQMQKTAKAITLFEVDTFEPQMKEMSVTIVQAAEKIIEAVALLGTLRDNSAKLHAITEEVTRIEERSDEIHDSGIKALFHKHREGGAMGYIVGAEIYDHLEKVVDRFEDVANKISAIVIEHA
jgi:predicted phosphate transport protein (TIGR00153 family)